MVGLNRPESNESQKLSLDEFLNKLLDQADQEALREEIEGSETDDNVVESFEAGEPVETEQSREPKIEIETPEVKAPKETVIPEAVQRVDEQIEGAVEKQIQAEGGDVSEVEAETGVKTELPKGDDDVTQQHHSFTKGPGEVSADAAAALEAGAVGESEHDNTGPVEAEQTTPAIEMKIINKDLIGKGDAEIPSGEEWHVEVVGKATVTINNNAKLVVTDMAAKNKFIIIGNGQLEIRGVDSQNEIERR